MSSRNPTFRKTRLPNGITLVSETYPGVKTLAIGVWVRIGSSFEGANEAGLSHCIEHLVFKGTKNRSASDIAIALESLGGELNAFTERELTCYHATVLSEHAEEAIEVLSDLVFHPVFDPNDLEKERQVLLQELSMIEDSPDDMIHDSLLGIIWKGESLGRNIIGSRKTLESFSREQIVRFYDRYYNPRNMVVSVAGGVDHRSLLKLCEKYFGEERGRRWSPTKRLTSEKRLSFHKGFRKIPSRSDQLHFLLGFAAPSIMDRFRFEALLLSIHLGGGMSSRLFQEVREKAALAYTIEADYIAFQRGGLINIYAQLAPKSLLPLIGIVRRELEAVATDPIPVERIEAMQNQIRGVLLLSHENMEIRQDALGRHEFFFGRYFSVNDLIQSVKRVNQGSLMALAKKIFRREKMGWILSGSIPRKLPRAIL